MIMRPATLEDSSALYRWRNDHETRAMCKSTSWVHMDAHCGWLEKRLQKPDFYIAEIGGEPVGTLRVDDGELSYTVAPEHRGKGYASAMLQWASKQFGPLKAQIKRNNGPSISAAKRGGHEVTLL